MDDRPVSVERLEVIDSGSSERLYSAMRDQSERGRDFRRRVRWMWLRQELAVRPGSGPVIDVRAHLVVISNEEPVAPLQAESV
jgi:hypothetical protein